MIDSSRDLEAREKSRDPGERLLSPLPATIVGLGQPEPPTAGASAYADDSPSRPGAKRTLVGFPSPPPAEEASPDSAGLADASDDDEVTVVGGYDDVTVVTPWDARGVMRAMANAPAGAKSEPNDDSAPDEDSVHEGWPDAPPDTSPQAAPAELEALAAELPEAPPATAFTDLHDGPHDTPLTDAPPELGDGGLLPETRKLVVDAAEPSSPAAQQKDSSSPDAVTEPLSLRSLTKSPPPPSKPPPPPRPGERRSRNESLPPPSSDRDLFVSRDTELQLFAPPIEMFGPGPRAGSAHTSSPPPAEDSAVGMQSDAPWYRPAERESTRPPKGSRTGRIALFGALAVVLGGGAALTGGLLPKSGRVLVTVSGPLDAPVSGASVLVDGKPGCAPAPCRITLNEGAYVLGVSAPAHRRAAEKSISVTAGAEEAVHFTVLPNDTSGIEVRSAVAGLRVSVDGVERGTTPITVRGLSAGKHTLRIAGNAQYSALETELELDADEIEVFEPKLVPQPEVVSAEELAPNDPEPQAAAPIAPPVAAAEPAPGGDLPPELAKVLRARANSATVAAAKVDLDTPPATLSKLTVTSTPASNVVVDGRPLGPTPRALDVTPGEHSVVFVHPTKGRKSVRVRAQAGKPVNASVSF